MGSSGSVAVGDIGLVARSGDTGFGVELADMITGVEKKRGLVKAVNATVPFATGTPSLKLCMAR